MLDKNRTIQLAPLPNNRFDGIRITPGGFTLLELLVASIITTLIMVTAVSALKSVTRSRNKLDEISTVKSELRFAADTVRRDLANLYRETNPDAKIPNFRLIRGSMVETETGPACSLTLYTTTRTPVRAGQPESDVVLVEYFLQQDQDADQIREIIQKHVPGDMQDQIQGRNRLLRRTLPNPLRQKTALGTVTALADNIIGFQIRYMAANKDEWQETWTSKTRLPELIEISLAARIPRTGKIIQNSFLVSFSRFAKIEGNNRAKRNDDGNRNSRGNTKR